MVLVSKACLKDENAYCILQHSNMFEEGIHSCLFVMHHDRVAQKHTLEHCLWLYHSYPKVPSLRSLRSYVEGRNRTLFAGLHMSLDDRHYLRSASREGDA